MTILESSNLIFAIFGRAADSNTAAILAANNDKNAAINTLLSSGASFQSNAELASAVYANTMGAELANSPLVALWTTLLDAGMMDKAQFVSQTMSFLDAVASVPAFAQVPFVQTFQARSQVSLNTASNSGVLNNSQLTAILQATTDAATANIALASANNAKAGAALSADVIKLAQENIANLASKDASGFAAKLIEQSNAAAAQINAPVIDAANPAAFVAQHGAEVASIAQAAGSTQAAANIAQATNEAKAQSGVEPASPAAPANPANQEQGANPANPEQGNTPASPATPATPATGGNAGAAGNTGTAGYVPQSDAPAQSSAVSAYNNVATFTSGAKEIDLKGGAVSYNGSAFKIENGALNINAVNGALSIKDSGENKLSSPTNVNAFIKTGGSLAKDASVNEKVAINAYLGGSAFNNGTTSAGSEAVDIKADTLTGADNIYAYTTGKITVAKLASLNNKAIDASKVNADIEITEALSDGDLTKVLSANDANDKLAVMVDSKVTNITGTAGSDTITFVAGEGSEIDLSGSKATDVEKIIIKANDNTTSIKALPGVDNEIIVGNTPFTVELSNGATNTNDIVNVSAATLQENGDVIQPNPTQMKIYWEIKNLKAGDKIDFGQTGVNTKIVEKTVTITEKELDDAVKAAADAAAAKAGGKQLVALDVENNEKAMQAAAAAEAKVAAALDKISKEVVGAAAPNTIYKVTIDYADHPLAGTYLAYNKTADGKLAANDDILVFLGKVNLDFTTDNTGLVTATEAKAAAAEVVPAS